ncbi:MAG: BrnA antitoxin family protein [Actinobacteria bacterium]|nr:BrnA antitoxin family protein [Actinomycetota bacterium]
MSAKKKTEKPGNKVPNFISPEEEAAFWESHSPLDFPGEFKAVEADIDRPLRHERVLSIRLDEMTITKMEALARQRHIGKSTLARMLIVQGLDKFSRTV